MPNKEKQEAIHTYGHERAAREKAAALAAKCSPDLNKLKKVIIDDRTTIYIKDNRTPEQARTDFLARIENTEVNRNSGRKNGEPEQDAA